MYAMASLGRMNLVGLIVTPVLTDFWTFSHPDWVDTAHDSRNNALASGIDPDCLPPITVGTEAESEQAGENKISEGAELYVKLINENYAKHPDRPMIINIGGQGGGDAGHGLRTRPLDCRQVHRLLYRHTCL